MLSKEKNVSLYSCNVIKTIMMLLVIIYHAVCLWAEGGWFNQAPAISSPILGRISNVLNFIHIYTFAFVSGYLFYYNKFETQKYDSFKTVALKRAKRLLLPYIIVALIWVIPFYVYFYSPTPIDVVRKYLLVEAPSQLWFLVMLFVLFCLFYLLSNIFNKCKIVLGGGISIGFYVLGIIGNIFLPNIFQIWTACKYLFFYWLGFVFRKEQDLFLKRIHWIFYLLCFVLIYVAYVFLKQKGGIYENIAAIAISPVCSTFGVLFVVTCISSFNCEKIGQNKLFNCLNKHNFTMYLFHQQLIYITIALLNGKASNALIVLCNLIIAIFGSLLISFVLSKIPKIKNIFGYK